MRALVLWFLFGITLFTPGALAQTPPPEDELTTLDILDICGSSMLQDRNICRITYQAVLWGMAISEAGRQEEDRFCLNEPLTHDGLQWSLDSYMEGNTRMLDRPFPEALLEALKSRYPCAK